MYNKDIKGYKKPVIEVILFEKSDIVTASGYDFAPEGFGDEINF